MLKILVIYLTHHLFWEFFRGIYQYLLLIMFGFSQKGKFVYSKEEIKNWINFGVANGYVNRYKKEQIIKWVELLIKTSVIPPKSLW